MDLSEATRRDCAERINRVIDHLEGRVAESTDLSALAWLACFSPFHVHRLFRAHHGCTATEWRKRKPALICSHGAAAGTVPFARVQASGLRLLPSTAKPAARGR